MHKIRYLSAVLLFIRTRKVQSRCFIVLYNAFKRITGGWNMFVYHSVFLCCGQRRKAINTSGSVRRESSCSGRELELRMRATCAFNLPALRMPRGNHSKEQKKRKWMKLYPYDSMRRLREGRFLMRFVRMRN